MQKQVFFSARNRAEFRNNYLKILRSLAISFLVLKPLDVIKSLQVVNEDEWEQAYWNAVVKCATHGEAANKIVDILYSNPNVTKWQLTFVDNDNLHALINITKVGFFNYRLDICEESQEIVKTATQEMEVLIA